MPELIIVTGASRNHFACLKNLLYTIAVFEPRTRTIVYDLGLTAAQRRQLARTHTVHRFPFEKYPPHVNIRVERGQYAWKPIIVSEVLRETRKMVLWLDAGCLLECPLTRIREALAAHGVFSPISGGAIERWTHPATLKYLKASPKLRRFPSRAGGISGFNGVLSWVRQLAEQWRRCALDPACIAPPGSSRSNHRQDQSILSILLYQFQRRHTFSLEDRSLGVSAYNDSLSPADVARRIWPASIRNPPPRTPGLKHLYLVPASGLCNRMRAIASARRLCQQLGARCSLVWDWGEFSDFFAPMPDVEIIKAPPAEVDKRMMHYPHHVTPLRVADVGVRRLELYSAYVFWGSHEPEIRLIDLRPFLPRPNRRLQRVVNAFSAKHLRNTVGFHMRRTDNTMSAQRSPDRLFIACARDLIAEGKKIFLATDNLATERKMKRLFGKAIITHPKRQKLFWRWPRGFDPVAAEDDMIDLFLLAKTEYVIGSFWSSFSGIAMLLNGSRKCAFLRVDPVR